MISRPIIINQPYINNMNNFLKTLFLLTVFTGTTVVAQENKVNGTVTDADGFPVASATILEKGTRNYTTTNIDGNFEFIVTQELPVTLVINAVGLKEQAVQIYEITEEPLNISLKSDNLLSQVKVTARRRTETAQNIPIPISIVGGAKIEDAGAFNVNLVKELVPSVQLYSSNPRNTGINVRGLGSPFGLTNDGLDPGVGFYVDGVYFARPA